MHINESQWSKKTGMALLETSSQLWLELNTGPQGTEFDTFAMYSVLNCN